MACRGVSGTSQHSWHALGLVALTLRRPGPKPRWQPLRSPGRARVRLINPFVGGIFAIAWGRRAIDLLRRRQHLLPAWRRGPLPPCLWRLQLCGASRKSHGGGCGVRWRSGGATRPRFPVSDAVFVVRSVLVPRRRRLWAFALVAADRALPFSPYTLFLMYYVRLNVDHEWIPFRAGQMLLAALAVMAAALFSAPQRPHSSA